MYSYQAEKSYIFTEVGQVMFLKIRDKANELADYSGAFTVEKAIGGLSGDSWSMLACVDRLVELKEFEYVRIDCATQFRVLVRR